MASERDLQDVINTLIAEGVGEGEEGMRRIAETILNRAEQRGISPAEVVRQRAQYTGYSNPGPAAVRAQQNPQALSAAQAAWQLAQGPDDPTGGANHYWNPNVVNPSWAGSMQSLGNYGNHAFATDRAVAPRRIAPTPAIQSPLMASSRVVTSPSGGNTALQNSLAAYATREGNRVAPATMQGRATTVASFPTTSSLRSPGAVNASVNSTRQQPALAAALAQRLNPVSASDKARGSAAQTRNVATTIASIPTRPATIGAAPSTRVVQTTRVGNSANNIAAQRNEQAMTRQAAPVATRFPLTIGAQSSFAGQDRSPALSQARLSASAPGLPSLYGTMSPNQVNAIGYPLSNKVSPTNGFRVTSPAPTPLARPGAFGVAQPTIAARPQVQAPIMAAARVPVPLSRPPMAPQPVSSMPLMAQRLPVQAPLNILVQGAQTIPPALTPIQKLQAQGMTAQQAQERLNNPDAASRVNGKSGLSASGGSYTRGYEF